MEKIPVLGAEQDAIAETLESSEDVKLTERYEKEILPLIEVLKPDNISLEDYENQVMSDLFAGVKKIETAQGKLIESQERILDEEKALLLSRLVAAIEDDKSRQGEESEFILKVKAALVLSGNIDTLNMGQNSFRYSERKIGEKVKPLFEHYVKEGNFETINALLDNLDKSAKFLGERSLYYSYTPHYGSGGSGWGEETQRQILTGKMSYNTYKYDKYAFENNPVSYGLIPKSHFERYFVEDIVSDTEGLRRLGLFQNYEAASELEQKIQDFRNKKNESNAFQKIDTEDIHQVAEILKNKAKENYSNYNRGARAKELFSIFKKKDFQDLIEFGVNVNDIDPLNLPKNLDSDVREYLVDIWIEDLQKNGKSGKNIRDILTLFTSEDLQKLLSSGVKVEPSEVPFHKLKEFKETTFLLFDSYTSMSSLEQEAFNKKILGTRLFEVLELSKFDEDETNQIILKLKDIAPENITDYLEVNYHIQDMISSRFADYAFVEKKSVRQDVFEKLKRKLDFIDDKELGLIKKKRLENIEHSFFAIDDLEKLPMQIKETLERFRDNYGKKGRHLVALALCAYGIENPDEFSRKMSTFEEVINKYYTEYIPEGAHVSMGIEYEVTKSLADVYKEESLLDYKKDIELVSRSANIGKGLGGIHEIATKPTYNPYILLAEMKLLQEAGFLDLNFEKYPNAPRGYHLSLVGESGLFADKNADFLQNVMTMTQLTGVLAGRTIDSTKKVHKKQFEIFDSSKQEGDRVEIKGMGCDTIEQFEKAIITSHHAGIAIQLCHKYLGDRSYINDLPETSEAFEESLQKENNYIAFESVQERDIVFEWLRLQKGISDAIDQHNESFVDSEFTGSFFDKNGEYIDTSAHIDIPRNRKLLEAQSSGFEKELYLRKESLFHAQTPTFVNALIRINNIFLKGPAGNENSSVNAQSMLQVTKKENYQGIEDGSPTESLFEKGGKVREGYYFVQGASEEMISHKSQILLNRFNKAIEELLRNKTERKIAKKAL